MQKAEAVAHLGQTSLLMPAWIKAGLHANDRLKLLLSLLQSTHAQARSHGQQSLDWRRELRATGQVQLEPLLDWEQVAHIDDDTLVVPHLDLYFRTLAADLQLMARPVLTNDATSEPDARVAQWHAQLRDWEALDAIDATTLSRLTRGLREQGDSLHLLVMDLHKLLNQRTGELYTDDIDGAHAWQIEEDDHELVSAFMKGLHRTSPLRFSHPGLDTAVTRDGDKLLIQNDIGTNDAHVLVIEVSHRAIELTYSELHKPRFEFFVHMLRELGFSWTTSQPMQSDQLNEGRPYMVGRARIDTETRRELRASLEALGSRIVFVIDWNRARKRLQLFVDKATAIELLHQGVRHEYGHMAWLMCGGEQLVFQAMQTTDPGAFQVGDRLDDVLGADTARQYLSQLMAKCTHLRLQGHPQSLLVDEARLLLHEFLRQHNDGFDLLEEHAAYGHGLAQTCARLFDQDPLSMAQVEALAKKAKHWEFEADQLLNAARQRADRHARWHTMVDLLTLADDVTDALEEVVFTASIAWREPFTGLPQSTLVVLSALADATFESMQDLVKAIQVVRAWIHSAAPQEKEVFIQLLWKIIRNEMRCDEHLREARLHILRELSPQPALMLIATDVANTLESASDHLLTLSHKLRRVALEQHEVLQ